MQTVAIRAAAIMVLPFQFFGCAHQPPAGDHTFVGYGNFFTPPFLEGERREEKRREEET